MICLMGLGSMTYMETWTFIPLRMFSKSGQLSPTRACQSYQTRSYWRQAPDGIFSASSAYHLFFLGREFHPAAAELWTSWAPLEIKIFVWLVLHDRLWTVDRLARRQLEHPECCVLCAQEDENLNHMLLGCSFVGSLGSPVSSLLPMLAVLMELEIPFCHLGCLSNNALERSSS